MSRRFGIRIGPRGGSSWSGSGLRARSATGATRSTSTPWSSSRRSSAVTISRSTGASGLSVTRRPPSWSVARSTPGTAASSVAASTALEATMSIARGPPRTISSDRALGDDAALVDDRDDVAGLLDLVEQVRGQQHGAALADELADQVAELEDAGRVEPVHRLVEDQQLGVGEQAARDAEALAHAERVGLDLLVGARREADAGERAVDRGRGRRALAGGGVDVQVLAAGEVGVEARLLDDRADAGERRGAAAGQVVAEQRASCPTSGWRGRAAAGSASSCRRRWRRGSRTRRRAEPRGRRCRARRARRSACRARGSRWRARIRWRRSCRQATRGPGPCRRASGASAARRADEPGVATHPLG